MEGAGEGAIGVDEGAVGAAGIVCAAPTVGFSHLGHVLGNWPCAAGRRNLPQFGQGTQRIVVAFLQYGQGGFASEFPCWRRRAISTTGLVNSFPHALSVQSQQLTSPPTPSTGPLSHAISNTAAPASSTTDTPNLTASRPDIVALSPRPFGAVNQCYSVALPHRQVAEIAERTTKGGKTVWVSERLVADSTRNITLIEQNILEFQLRAHALSPRAVLRLRTVLKSQCGRLSLFQRRRMSVCVDMN